MPPNKPTPPLPTLPMHLAMTLGSAFSWPIALQCASAGLLPLKKEALELLQKKEAQKNLHEQSKNRATDLIKALLRYYETDYTRQMPEPPCIWQQGSARLLDYGLNAENATQVVLFVPSLINRYYILDLERERSFMRYLSEQGIYPLVLDWGTPSNHEKDFGVNDYVEKLLLPAIDFLVKTSGQPITLAGYCMGGVLSLAAAQLRPKKINKLALLATPWNFHCETFKPFILEEAYRQHLSSLLSHRSSLPADVVQALFYLTAPYLFEQKFLRFLQLDPESRAARDFVALEHWVNDGVPMTANVAQDCLIGWAQENQLAVGSWQIAGKKINPRKIKQPTFIAIPKQDHVVPFDCAAPLAEFIPDTTVITPSAGHVSMIVGNRAKSELWVPLVEWLNQG